MSLKTLNIGKEDTTPAKICIMIKINKKEYNLKVTLGFYKNLSFPQSELNSIHDDATRLFEVLKLALYYGNKKEQGWLSIADMEKVISDNDR